MAITSAIDLPRDQFAHAGAPKEWWWHTGTLRCGNRLFGFEVTATGHFDQDFQFTEIMITDVQARRHFQKTTGAAPFDPKWAQSDPALPWYVRLCGPLGANGAVSMQAPVGDPFSMSVAASFEDEASGLPCMLNLLMKQNDLPLLVWGTGVREVYKDKPPLQANNYYYSFTKLHAVGTLQIGAESFDVEGLTWMDHEYGAFPTGTQWVLQDMQLDNGVHISNYFSSIQPVENQATPSNATILWPDGKCTFVSTVTTPIAPTWTNAAAKTYCLRMRVDIAELNASFLVTSLVPDQEFAAGPVYEGVAHAVGSFDGKAVSGTAWLEQSIG